jgi:hypothetical protein
MTVHSQNGYVACDPSLIGKYTIPGSKVTINLRKGDVSVVLLDFFAWYNAEIEPLHQDDTGGYNCRTIEDSEVQSNHGSGTAGDLRWKDHARGKRNQGFTQAEVNKINGKLKEYAGVIRWGNNYSSKSVPDAMHFEINAGPAAVKAQADRIRAKNAAGGDDMTLDDMKTFADLVADAIVTKLVTKDLGHPGGGDTIGIVLQTGVLQNSNKIVAKLDEISAKLTPAG